MTQAFSIISYDQFVDRSVWSHDQTHGVTSKLTDFNLHVVAEEQVAQFQVTVDHPVVVEVVDALDGLPHEVSGLGLSHRLPTLVQLQKGLKEGINKYTHFINWILKNACEKFKRSLEELHAL